MLSSTFLTAFAVFTAVLAAPANTLEERRALVEIRYPNYLNPIKEATPNTAYPTQYTGTVSYVSPQARNEVRMLVGFDVPTNTGTRCAISFRLAASAPWAVTGTGKMSVWSLSTEFVNGVSSWNNRPAKVSTNPQFNIIQPLTGGIAAMSGPVIPCLRGKRQDFEVAITSPDTSSFEWFELNDPRNGITLDIYT